MDANLLMVSATLQLPQFQTMILLVGRPIQTRYVPDHYAALKLDTAGIRPITVMVAVNPRLVVVKLAQLRQRTRRRVGPTLAMPYATM